MEKLDSSSDVVLGFISNIMFTTRIESVVKGLGYQTRWIDPLMERQSPYIDEINQIKPRLILVDLGISEIQWDVWIKQVKSKPTTQTIPLVCFFSHMDVDVFKSAKNAGADRVFSRSQFFSAIADIILKYTVPRHNYNEH